MLSDDLRDSRNSVSELTRRLHEYELEIRRLENEREEITAAYKEAEAVSFLINILIYSKTVLILFLYCYFRDAKPKKSVLKVWPQNTECSVMTQNAALPLRKKKLKPFGEY